MKNVLLNGKPMLSIVFITTAIVLAGCDSGSAPPSGASAVTVNNPAPVAGGLNCTMNPDGSGGFSATCDNGMTLTGGAAMTALLKGPQGNAGVQGVAGAAGATGPRGPAGLDGVSPPHYISTYSANLTVVSMGLQGMTLAELMPGHGTTVQYGSYDAYGNMYRPSTTIYFQTANCTGDGYFQTIPVAAGNVIVVPDNAGTDTFVYVVGTVPMAPFTTLSYRGSGGGCFVSTSVRATGYWTRVVSTTTTMPAAIVNSSVLLQ